MSAQPDPQPAVAARRRSVGRVGACSEAQLLALVRSCFEAELVSDGSSAGTPARWRSAHGPSAMASAARVVLGIGDDGALLAAHGTLAITVDAISEGSDWLAGRVPAAAIGHRAVAVNLSDLAAMGATPVCLLCSLELAPRLAVADLEAGLAAAAALATAHGAQIIGGDLGVRRGPTTWTMTAIGVIEGTALLRSAARPGDAVWLIGALGLASLGLRLLRDGAPADTPPGLRARCLAAHMTPTPQIAWGHALAATGARIAAIDVSDGLGADATRLADASGVALELDLTAPPGLDAAELAWAMGALPLIEAIAAGGDDYALLVCAPPELDVAALTPNGAQPPQRIGEAKAGTGVRLWFEGADVSAHLGGFAHGAAASPAPSARQR